MSSSGKVVDFVNSHFVRYVHCTEEFGTDHSMEVLGGKISPIKRPLHWINVNRCGYLNKSSNPPSELGGIEIPWTTNDNESPKNFNPVIGGGRVSNGNGHGPQRKTCGYDLWKKDNWSRACDQMFANKINWKKEETNVAQDQKPLSQKQEEQLENLSHVQNPAVNKPSSLGSPQSLRPKSNEPTNSELPAKLDANSTLMEIVTSNSSTLQEHEVEIFNLRKMIRDILQIMYTMNGFAVPDYEELINSRSAPLAETVENANTAVNNSINNLGFLNNQVPPGIRSNNYVDNFRSCALQNYFDTTATVGMNQNAVYSTGTSPPVAVNNKPVDLSMSDVNLFQNIHNEDDSFRTRNMNVPSTFDQQLNIITTNTIATNTDPELYSENNDVTNSDVESDGSDLDVFASEIDGFEFIVNPIFEQNLLSVSTNNESLLKKSKTRIISQMVSKFIVSNKEHHDFLIRLFTELQMLSKTSKSRSELIQILDAFRNKKDVAVLIPQTSSESDSSDVRDSSDVSDEVSSIEFSDDDGIQDSYISIGDFTN